MKFSVKSLSIPAQKTEETVSVESLLALSEEVHASYQDLSETEKSLEEVQQVVANIDMSIAAIEKYGEQAVQVLNVDKSLTELMGTEVLNNVSAIIAKLNETKITSLEGFGDKVKNFIAKIIAFVKGFFNKIRGAFAEAFGNYDKIVTLVRDSQIRNIEERIANGSFKEKFKNPNFEFKGGGKVTVVGIHDLKNVKFAQIFNSVSSTITALESTAINHVKDLLENRSTVQYTCRELEKTIDNLKSTISKVDLSIGEKTECDMGASDIKTFYDESKKAYTIIEKYVSEFIPRLQSVENDYNNAIKAVAAGSGTMRLDEIEKIYGRLLFFYNNESVFLSRLSSKTFMSFRILGAVAVYINANASIVSSGQ